jgi:hypothetical protein
MTLAEALVDSILRLLNDTISSADATWGRYYLPFFQNVFLHNINFNNLNSVHDIIIP